LHFALEEARGGTEAELSMSFIQARLCGPLAT